MSEKSWAPFNGKSSMASRVIEALIVAVIVGVLGIWGNSKVVDEKLRNICSTLDEMKVVSRDIGKIAIDLKLENEQQWSMIKRNTEIIDRQVLHK